MSIRAHLRISGRVQGVFFRDGTRDMATRLGLGGWVRNMPDGTVEAVFEGNEGRVKEAVEWCRNGPPHARVSDVRVEWERPAGEFSGFEIRY